MDSWDEHEFPNVKYSDVDSDDIWKPSVERLSRIPTDTQPQVTSSGVVTTSVVEIFKTTCDIDVGHSI